MVYDCFQFFNEIEILKLRLNILKDVVDKFVISESTVTFSGEKKPLYFEAEREQFEKFHDKIIYNIVDDTPVGTPFERDSFQKCAVARGLKVCRPEDIIIFSDVDEIPNPNKIIEILQCFNQKKIYHFAQRMFYGYLNFEDISGKLLSVTGEFEDVKHKQWLGTKVCSYKMLEKYTLEDLRKPERKAEGVRVAAGGWHFGYMGGNKEDRFEDRIAYKIKSAAHQEFNNKEVLGSIKKRISMGADIFGRDACFKRVKIDETYPLYLCNNIKMYQNYVMPKDTLKTYLMKTGFQVKRKLKSTIYKLKQLVKKILRMK